MIHWRFGVGIYAIGGEVSVPGIPLQQTLAFQVPGNAVGNGVCQMGEFITGWRLDPAKPHPGFIGAADVNTIQEKHMKMDVSCEVLRYVE